MGPVYAGFESPGSDYDYSCRGRALVCKLRNWIRGNEAGLIFKCGLVPHMSSLNFPYLGTYSQFEHRATRSRYYNTIQTYYAIYVCRGSFCTKSTDDVFAASQEKWAPRSGTRGRRAMAYPVLYTLEITLSLHIGPHHHKAISRRHTVMLHLL